MRTRTFIRGAVVGLLFAAMAPGAHADSLTVDYRYTPARAYALLSYPFDYHKTILLESGKLAYDFGPGPYHEAGTEIGFAAGENPDTVAAQYFADPLVPVATTVIRNGERLFSIDAYCALPTTTNFPGSFASGAVRRLGHLAGTVDWARPAGTVDPAFRNTAWGTNRPVEYRVRVRPGSAHLVVLGVCEGYKSSPGARVLECRVEGAPPQKIDPVGDGRKNIPRVLLFAARDENVDGEISIEAGFAPESGDPNVILNGFWVFPAGTSVDTSSLIRGTLSASAEVYWQCGRELDLLSGAPRTDVLIATRKRGTGSPLLVIHTRRTVRFDTATGEILLPPGMTIRCTPRPSRFSSKPGIRENVTYMFPPGAERVGISVTQGPGKREKATALQEEPARASAYWHSRQVVPAGRIVIPDSALQSILDVNIRAIYQAADIVDGARVFQPGPTVYRGLFVYDLLLMNEALLALGDTCSARGFIEGTFHYQQSDGRLRVLTPANSFLETPVFVHAMGRYARLTNNRRWMELQWPRMVKGMEWIRNARLGTMSDSAAPGYGLFPAGFVDGGLAGAVPDFSTAAFALMAIETAARTAHWLGHPERERQWRALFDDLMTSYTCAARRSLRPDRFGTTYLPVAVGDTQTTAPPQRGQYGILGVIRYADYFARYPFLDSVARGDMAMLDSTLEEGMIADAGWTRDAVWSWLAFSHASALSAMGKGSRAASMVYAAANHAGRLGTWVEEQQVRAKGTRSTGDGSDAETSACLVGAVRDLLYVTRGDTLDLLPGVPRSWFSPGAHIAIRDVPTDWGRLTIDARSSLEGVSIRVSIAGPAAGGTDSPIVSVSPETLLNASGAAPGLLPPPLLRRYDRQRGVEIRVKKG